MRIVSSSIHHHYLYKEKYMKKIIALVVTFILLCMPITVNASTNDGISTFVRSLYSDCLDREPDSAGFDDWCNKLSTGQISGKECAYGFFFSAEFQNKANTLSDAELIDIYYRVFLNRTADSAGKAYWSSKIANTSNDISILFTGFADSTEFAQKCASYGITVGNSISVPTTTRNAVDPTDAMYINQGYEVYYVDCGNTVIKCYALFYDVSEHMNMVNNYRIQNGLEPYTLLTDRNDSRVEYARQRAVEVAFSANHIAPLYQPNGVDTRRPVSFSENMSYGAIDLNGSFVWFQNSPGHNRNMLKPISQRRYFSCACCECLFVLPDGTVTRTSPAESMGYTRGWNDALVQCYWA